jgi:hypothetical protein
VGSCLRQYNFQVWIKRSELPNIGVSRHGDKITLLGLGAYPEVVLVNLETFDGTDFDPLLDPAPHLLTSSPLHLSAKSTLSSLGGLAKFANSDVPPYALAAAG